MTSRPFGTGWQGFVIVAIVILATALFAATRSDWTSLLISALVLPLIVYALFHVLGRFWRERTKALDSTRGPKQDFDVVTFLARTNPFMFLLFGALSRQVDEDRNQEILQSGPYGMGQRGYLIALTILIAPLVLTLIITAITGQLPGHTGPHIP